MPVADREPVEHRAIEAQRRRRIDRVDAVLLVDGLAEDDSPALAPLLEEVVEPPRADHVALDVVHRRALRDGHLRLGDRPLALHVDGRRTEEVEDPHPALEALPADADELVRGALEPGRHHAAVVVPDRPEAVPVAGVAPDDPVLDELRIACLSSLAPGIEPPRVGRPD